MIGPLLVGTVIGLLVAGSEEDVDSAKAKDQYRDRSRPRDSSPHSVHLDSESP